VSFVWFADEPLRTREEIARVVHAISLKRGLDELATVIALMTIAVEVGVDGNWWCPWNANDSSSQHYPFDSQSDDGRSVGYFQQQNGRAGDTLPVGDRDNWWGSMQTRMALAQAADTFLSRLSEDHTTAANNPALAGVFAQRVQGSAFPDRYAQKWDEAWAVLRRALDEPKEQPVTDRPAYNEFPIWSPSSSSRNGVTIDAVFLHTQEGGGGDSAAEDLAHYLADPANQVSYHYAVSQASDSGVTVVDCVDTDRAAWSVLSANARSINLCFAGSRVAWTREQWMQQSNAIDVAAYLVVQDCKKYSIPTSVIVPPYEGRIPGISDHAYVTKILGDGTHTDVGPGFPWDYFSQRVAFWTADRQSPVAQPNGPVGPADDQLTLRWNCLGGQTLVEAIAEIRDKVCGTSDRAKEGSR
jgi:N-acetyl-anhydromuramyl-L-alanine amidase AmpD